LKRLYQSFWACEAKHGKLFVSLALKYFPEQELLDRLGQLVRAEGEMARNMEWRPSLH
jgi:tRNA isopentenyl-2-thiomethyl-A-37 hydroxylase MiaE